MCVLPFQQRRKRYFVLWSNAVLEYYSSSEKRPQDYLKTIDLSHCEDMVAPISNQGRENLIKLSIVQADKVRHISFLSLRPFQIHLK